MKKRNLFLSLICSIILTVALVAVTVASVVVPNFGKNPLGPDSDHTSQGGQEVNVPADINDNADGTEENPYYIYSAETFMALINEHGAEGAYFELYNDVDFAGVDYVTLFNKDVAFNGHINGNGYSLKNITINVNKDNLNSFIYQSANDENRYNAHIAIFGSIEDAEIRYLAVEGLKITVADEVYTYVNNLDDLFGTDMGAAMNEITVASVAAIAKNSTVSVNVDAVIDADAYSVYAENHVQGFNAIGGVVAVADNCVIASEELTLPEEPEVEVPETPVEGEEVEVPETEEPVVDDAETVSDEVVEVEPEKVEAQVRPIVTGKVNVQIITNVEDRYFVGGVAGYAYDSTIDGVNVNLTFTTRFIQALYVGGVVGYGETVTIQNTNVVLDAKESDVRFDTSAVETIDDVKVAWVSGIACVLRANDNTQVSTINNVTVEADVDLDAIYAGAINEIWSTDKTYDAGENYVTIKDVIVTSNVNVLKAFGLVKTGSHYQVELTKTVDDIENEFTYNIKLTGNVLLKDTDDSTVAALYVGAVNDLLTGDRYCETVGGFETIKIEVSSSIYAQVEKLDTIRTFDVEIVG